MTPDCWNVTGILEQQLLKSLNVWKIHIDFPKQSTAAQLGETKLFSLFQELNWKQNDLCEV